jgi:hypothetical protein
MLQRTAALLPGFDAVNNKTSFIQFVESAVE